MRIETVVIVHKDNKVLLGFKRPEKRFGGMWNGFGGGVEGGESLEECARRETQDETGITPLNLRRVGKVLFKFETEEQDHEVHIYEASDYTGVLTTSKDFARYKEFPLDKIPYEDMMPADEHWLPLFVQGKMFTGEIIFDRSFRVESYQLNEVENID